MAKEKQPTHAVVLMRRDEVYDSDRFSLLETFPSLNSATTYAGQYNPELMSGDVVIIVQMDLISEISEHKANNTRYVWFVKDDGYPIRVPNRKDNSWTYLSGYYSGYAGAIISAAQDADVDEKVIIKSLYECGVQIYDELKLVDKNAEFKLSEIKGYLNGEAVRPMTRSDRHSFFSNTISQILSSPIHAADDLKNMDIIDVIAILKSHITLGVLLSAATKNNGRKL